MHIIRNKRNYCVAGRLFQKHYTDLNVIALNNWHVLWTTRMRRRRGRRQFCSRVHTVHYSAVWHG